MMNSRVTVAAAVATVTLVTVLSYTVFISKPALIQPPSLKFQGDLCPARNGHIPAINTFDELSLDAVRISYRDYGSNHEILCNVMLRMGNLGDGGWEVCDDEPVRPKHDCLVYSFGINNDFSFDDMIAKHYGCEVHAFDPSMKMGDTRRSEKVTFHHLGVYGSNTVINKGWPVKTIAEIKRMLGHANRHIDVMKMDVEGSEWPTLDTALRDGSLDNVTQFLFEIHNFADDKSSITSKLKILHRLRDRGFRIFYSHKNHQCSLGKKTETPLRAACHELHMIYLPSCEAK